jgi:hypothetical protein
MSLQTNRDPAQVQSRARNCAPSKCASVAGRACSLARSLAPSRERGTEGRKTATVGATDTQRLLTSGSVAGSTGSSLCPSVRTN